MKVIGVGIIEVGDLVMVPYSGRGIILAIREGCALIHIGHTGEVVRRHPTDLRVLG